MTNWNRATSAVLALLAIALAGCRQPGSSSEAVVRWPVFGGEPVAKNWEPPEGYSSEAAGETGRAATTSQPGPAAGATAQGVAEPSPVEIPASPPPPEQRTEIAAAPERAPPPAQTQASQTASEQRGQTSPQAQPQTRLPAHDAVEASGPARQVVPAPPGPAQRAAGQQLKIVNALIARVNDDIITREDLVRDLRPDIALWQRTLSEQEFQARLRAELRQRLPAEISRRLILQETDRQLNEGQKEYLKKEVEKERARQVALAGGSLAAWQARLAEFGLNEDAWRKFQLEQFTIQAFLNDRIGPQLSVTRDEILACYEQAKKEKYTVQPRAHMQLIKLRLEDHADLEGMLALARSLSGRARKGEDFATLAREYSKDPKAAEGGDWGLLHQGSFRVEAVNQALFTLPVGGVSEPIVDGNAVYIVRVAARIEGRVIPFAEVQDECRDAAKKAKRDKLVAEFVQRLYDKGHIDIHEENL